MTIDVSKEDLSLLQMLLGKAEVETRVEIHHAKIFDYKDFLKKRENHIHELLEKIEKAASCVC